MSENKSHVDIRIDTYQDELDLRLKYLEIELNKNIGRYWWKSYINAAFWNNISMPISLIITIITALITAQTATNNLLSEEVMKEIIKTSTGVSQARKQLKSVGAVGIRDYSAEVSKLDAEIAAGMKKPGFFDRYIKNPLQKFSMASDNVIRQAIYAQTIKETGDKALATERAFEVINFRRTGSNKLISMGRQVIHVYRLC